MESFRRGGREREGEREFITLSPPKKFTLAQISHGVGKCWQVQLLPPWNTANGRFLLHSFYSKTLFPNLCELASQKFKGKEGLCCRLLYSILWFTWQKWVTAKLHVVSGGVLLPPTLLKLHSTGCWDWTPNSYTATHESRSMIIDR